MSWNVIENDGMRTDCRFRTDPRLAEDTRADPDDHSIFYLRIPGDTVQDLDLTLAQRDLLKYCDVAAQRHTTSYHNAYGMAYDKPWPRYRPRYPVETVESKIDAMETTGEQAESPPL